MTFRLRLTDLSPHAKDLALNFGAVFGERLLRLMVGLWITGLLARSLGVEGFGFFNLGLSLGALALTVASLGLDGMIVREIARRPHRATSILVLTGRWRFWAGLVALGGCGVYAGVGDTDPLATVLLASGCLGAALTGPTLAFQACGQARKAAVWQTGVFLVVGVARAVLAVAGATLVSLAATVLAEVLLSGLVVWLVWRRSTPRETKAKFSGKLQGVLARRLLGESWRWWLAAISVGIYMRFDQLLLHRLGGAAELGVFVAASRITEQSQLLPMALAVSMLGQVARTVGAGERRRLMSRYLAVSAGAGWLCALGTILVGPWLIPLVFGAGYDDSVDVLRLQALAMPLLFVGVARAQILLAEGRAFSGLGSTFAAAVISLALNGLLIPRIGAMGAATATVAAQAVASWLTNYLMRDMAWVAAVQTKALCSPIAAWREA